MDKQRATLKTVVIALLIWTFVISCLAAPKGNSPTETVAATLPPTIPPATISPATKTPIVIVIEGEDSVRRVAASLNFLMTGDTSLPSYHLESVNQSPCRDGSAISQCVQEMNADVQGTDVHFTCTETKAGKETRTTEVYLIGDQEYDVLDGVVQPEAASLDSLVWIMWPANTATIIATGASNVSPAGTEDLDGRPAEIYTLDSTSDLVEGVAGIQLPVTSVKGRVWVDQQTGALVKADLDYQADVRDTAGTVQGSGSGHLDITITRIGKVTVSLP